MSNTRVGIRFFVVNAIRLRFRRFLIVSGRVDDIVAVRSYVQAQLFIRQFGKQLPNGRYAVRACKTIDIDALR